MRLPRWVVVRGTWRRRQRGGAHDISSPRPPSAKQSRHSTLAIDGTVRTTVVGSTVGSTVSSTAEQCRQKRKQQDCGMVDRLPRLRLGVLSRVDLLGDQLEEVERQPSRQDVDIVFRRALG